MTEWLNNALAYALPIVTPLVVGLIVQGIRYLSAKLNFTLTETQQKQLTFALEQGVSAAAERYRATGIGEVKASFALAQAKSLAPDAMGKVKPETQKVLVEATYARLRPSLPAPSMYAVPGADIPVEVVDLDDRDTVSAKKKLS
jgi:hypothetical protein